MIRFLQPKCHLLHVISARENGARSQALLALPEEVDTWCSAAWLIDHIYSYDSKGPRHGMAKHHSVWGYEPVHSVEHRGGFRPVTGLCCTPQRDNSQSRAKTKLGSRDKSVKTLLLHYVIHTPLPFFLKPKTSPLNVTFRGLTKTQPIP